MSSACRQKASNAWRQAQPAAAGTPGRGGGARTGVKRAHARLRQFARRSRKPPCAPCRFWHGVLAHRPGRGHHTPSTSSSTFLLFLAGIACPRTTLPSFRTSSGGVQAAERRAGRRLGGGPGTGRGVVGRGGRGPAPDGGGCLRRAPFSSAGRLTPAGVSSREQPGAGSKGRCLGTRPGSAPRSCRKTISHNSTGQSSAHSAGVPARRGLSRIPRRSARDCPARAERRAGTLT